MNKIFEVIVANGFDKDAIKEFKSKKLKLLISTNLSLDKNFKFNSINNSMLIQSKDNKIFSKKDFKIVSKKKPTKSQFENLIFALMFVAM